MKKTGRILAGALALSLALGLSACGAGTKLSEVKNAAVAAAEEMESAGSTVSVAATSSIKVTPDIAQVNIGVTTIADTASAAQENNTATVDAVTQALKDLGVPEEDIQTSYFNIYANYDWSKEYRETTGYTAEMSMSITNRPIDTVGSLIAACVAAGANNVNGVQYSYSGYDATYEEALAQAVHIAEAKAGVLAEAAGKTLGEVKTLTEGYQNTAVRYDSGFYASAETADADMAKVAAVSIAPGQVEVTAQVSATYEMN